MKIKRQLVRKFPARPEYSLFRKRKSLFCFGRELPINRRTCTQIDVCPDEIGTKSREFAVLFPVSQGKRLETGPIGTASATTQSCATSVSWSGRNSP